MNSHHRIISVFACVQAFCVVAGTLFVSQVLKMFAPTVGDPRTYRALAFWIREWGFVLLLVPVLWAILALFDSRAGSLSRAIFALGFLLTAGLVVFYGLGLLSAGRMPMISVVQPAAP